MKNFIRQLFHFFNLEAELENQEDVYEEIKKGIIFKGTNLWILIFAIIIASVGLNMNSTAVIIGAMLISPLMGPINGMGYSIATYDFDLFRKSLKNFSFAILAALLTSTIYFALSPISTAHSELLARTSPTIYDVLIALFGGLAGIVAICSKQKGNVIPGVAIATALMPPLCTAGYGLATGQYNFFLGAIYLFTINTIFIAIASVWISQILKFPIRSIIDIRKKKKIENMITATILLVLLPSIYFGYNLVKQEKFQEEANRYVINVSHYEGNYLLKHTIDPKNHQITLVYGGPSLVEQQKTAIVKMAENYNLGNCKVLIEQGLSLGNLNEPNFQDKYNAQIVSLNTALIKRNFEIDSIRNEKKQGQVLLKEIRTIYPQIVTCTYSESLTYSDSKEEPAITSLVILSSNAPLRSSDKTKIRNWFKQRLKRDHLKVFYE